MSLSLSLRRLGIAVAAGALVTAAAVTPAVADDEWGDEDPGISRQDDDGGRGDHNQQDDDGRGDYQQGDNDGRGDYNQNQHGDHNNNPRRYRGVVTASELALRSRPDRGSRIIRYAYRGDRVSIFCKTNGSNVQGNHLWYLLTDGTWAWGSARYIDNIGPAPRWC